MNFKKLFSLKAIIPLSLLMMAPTTLAEEARYNATEIMGVECPTADGEPLRISMNNFYPTVATVTITDINGNVSSVSQDVRIFEQMDGYERYQLEQLASIAAPEEGKAIYQAALDMIIDAERTCATAEATDTAPNAEENDSEPVQRSAPERTFRP